MKRSAIVLSALLLSCAPKTAPSPNLPAAGGSPLRTLAADFWAEKLRSSPTWATRLGDHSHDDVMDDNSELERVRHHDALTGFLARLRAIDRERLPPQD